jgi:hypothetical protein
MFTSRKFYTQLIIPFLGQLTYMFFFSKYGTHLWYEVTAVVLAAIYLGLVIFLEGPEFKYLSGSLSAIVIWFVLKPLLHT